MSPLFDARCPRCNQVVVGLEEVATEVPDHIPSSCRRCRTVLRLVTPEGEPEPGDIPTAYFEPWTPRVGDFVTEVLVTDTVTYEVVAKTPKTLRIRRTRHGEIVKRTNEGGNPYPCVWHEAVSDPGATERVVRLRKDGCYRSAKYGNPLRPATVIDGKPVSYTDYRE